MTLARGRATADRALSDAARLLGDSAAVLLDFDGPVTPLMPAPANMYAADAARRALTEQ